jgi:hypothetical protein
MSNESVVIASMTSEQCNPGCFAIDDKKFTTARCGISTPFGSPVEPEV